MSSIDSRLSNARRTADERDRLYRALFESANDSIMVLRQGQIIDVNRCTERLLGLPREELIGATPVAFSPSHQPDGRRSEDAVRAQVGQVLSGEIASFDWTYLRADGTTFEVEVTINNVVLEGEHLQLGVGRELTDERRMERTLASQQRLLRSVVDSVQDIIFVTEGTKRILLANEPLAKACGASVATLEGALIDELAPPQRDLVRRLISDSDDDAASSANSIHLGNVHYCDHTEHSLDIVRSPIANVGQRRERLLVVTTDVTERIRLADQFLQSQKMEVIGRLAGGIAHDFNNMLAAIMMTAELSRDTVAPDSETAVDLEQIVDTSQRAARLSQQLLVFAQKQATSPKVLSLNHVVDSTFRLLRRVISEDTALRFAPGEELWPVHADPSQLDQLLLNLVVNARDAIEAHGEITIATENVPSPNAPENRHPNSLPVDAVRLTVSDNGCGMDADTQSKIFEPFFTTKPQGRGTGLGLATVHGVVNQNGGTIDVESTAGVGTSFTILLPRFAQPVSDLSLRSMDSQPLGRQECILLVEDDPMLLSATARLLESRGYRVLSTTKPEQAIQLHDEHQDEIRLLITDFIMPGMDGAQLMQTLRSANPGLKILFTSGYISERVSALREMDDSTSFVEKPYDGKSLVQKVQELLDV